MYAISFRRFYSIFPQIKCYYSTFEDARKKLQLIGEGKIFLDKYEDKEIAVIKISNPNKKNAISGYMMTELEKIVDDLQNWKNGKAVILTADGDTFCSGGDITSQLSKYDDTSKSNINTLLNPEIGNLMSAYMQKILNNLFCLPLLTVTLINGKAIGGGAELTTSTDFRVFNINSEVSFVQGRMGLVTGWGGGTRLVKIIGYQKALHLLTSSEKLQVDEALSIGYADHVIDPNSFLSPIQQTINWLEPKLKHHCTIVQSFKKIIVGARDLSFEGSLKNERKIFAPLWGGPINAKALQENIKHK